ncbi:pentapeptide repeat-containing protein [Nostoc sp. 'Peltigera membranacea cyanobiont' N6]|uniref:pentapeptide repeat-containing protein n=1 Tax=Nostoc sp. 'Peltigera membranacea cyanobiont' N6 TaxID=1261031 RepID=UPI000CF32F35|nr:pentapeptide repeat-containing protein [Nostoc sp. 'Peltigera membranacea cyanobiont' N6]AVH68419.1 pentapeptide repeat-containing protein [Nostoc sp. 'Peltigera membranacea cyanobiont' N6]
MSQDFSGQNLRGRSFKGQNLEGVNFSGADMTKANFSNATLREANFTNAILKDAVIKGANFTQSNLKNANLSGAKAGLPLYWAIRLLILLFLLAVLSGFTSEYVISALYNLSKFESRDSQKVSGVATLLVLIFFFLSTIHKGLYESLQISIFVSAIASSFTTAIISVFTDDKSSGVAFAGVVSAAIVNAGIVDSACIILGITQLNLWNSVVLAFIFGLASFFGAIVVPIIIPNISVFKIYYKMPDQIIFYVILTALVIIFIMVLSIYIAYKAMKGDKKFTLIHKISIFVASIGGTCFCNADLTEANLTHAILQNTDLREAILKKTCFYEAKGLDSVRFGECYLQNPLVRQLLITGQGQNKNFDRQDLRGVNFERATLEDASFIGADLSDANLQQTDLSRAKLVQTQLDGTNFIGATLTGAYIEDWNITNQTNFTGVRCEYVYMRLPTRKHPDPYRKPDNRQEVFADGEFGDFIKPIFDTLDLYHSQGVDPRAIAISFKQLAENHPDAELEIVAMEKRGQDKFLLRAKTASTTDKSQLSAEYFDTYNEIKALPEREIKLLLAEKDSRIRSLENFVNQALQRPSYYSSTQIQEVGSMASNPGGFSVGGSVGGNVNNVQGDNNRAVQGDNNQAVLGDGNQVAQQNQVGADTAESLTKEDVVKLLAQLETLIKGAELPADTKEELVEDLSAAKKATDKEEPNKQRALERLGTVAETLEKTSKGVEAGQKVWTIAKPIIVKVATWLGVAAGSHLLGL